MAKQAQRPVEVPDKVSVSFAEGTLSISGPLGKTDLDVPPVLRIDVGEGRITIRPVDGERLDKKVRHALKGMPGLYRSLISRRIEAVTTGFAKTLNVVGVGYQVEVKEQVVSLKVGFSCPVEVPIPEGITVKTERGGVVIVSGLDPEAVGNFSARLRAVRPPEPYGGKGIRYADEYVRRKVTKTAAGAAG